MKKFHVLKQIILALLLVVAWDAVAQNKYYLGVQSKFNPEIPTPNRFLVSRSALRWCDMRKSSNFKLLDQLSDRVQLEVIGHTYENREHVILIVHLSRKFEELEAIRQNHLKLIDPSVSISNYDDQKVIVHWD
jgi:hypothetical protein